MRCHNAAVAVVAFLLSARRHYEMPFEMPVWEVTADDRYFCVIAEQSAGSAVFSTATRKLLGVIKVPGSRQGDGHDVVDEIRLHLHNGRHVQGDTQCRF